MRIWGNNRGAVLAEFSLAFLPIAAMFTVLMEVSRYSIARIAVQHAASVSVRACSVIQEPQYGPGSKEGVDGTEADIETAGKMALKPWMDSNTLSDVTVDCPAQGDPSGTDEATVKASYHCSIPLGGQLVCGTMAFTSINSTNGSVSADPTVPIETKARMAHQGSRYIIAE